jgi:hypothetical protein
MLLRHLQKINKSECSSILCYPMTSSSNTPIFFKGGRKELLRPWITISKASKKLRTLFLLHQQNP